MITLGDVIRWRMDADGRTQGQLAALAGISRKHLSKLAHDAAPLTVPIASRLGPVLHVPPAVLLTLQTEDQLTRQLHLDRRDDRAGLVPADEAAALLGIGGGGHG